MAFDKVLMGAGWLAAFQVWDAATWTPAQYCGWALAVVCGLELEALAATRLPVLFGFAPSIPVRGKHLDELSPLDRTFIWCNRMMTCLFAYHAIRHCWLSDRVKWAPQEATLLNTVVAYALLFIVYDFFYTNFHRFLHLRPVYRFIHKHHHRQKAPSRGTLDAINVHPFEFACGEYNHLLAIFLIPCHVYAAAMFIVTGGLLASWNHTRFDLALPWLMWDTKAHDEHHVIPTVNYGQYIMLWDHVMGSYQPPPALRAGKLGKE